MRMVDGAAERPALTVSFGTRTEPVPKTAKAVFTAIPEEELPFNEHTPKGVARFSVPLGSLPSDETVAAFRAWLARVSRPVHGIDTPNTRRVRALWVFAHQTERGEA